MKSLISGNRIFFGHARLRRLPPILAVVVAALWPAIAIATVTQGDFSIYGTLTSTWAGRWGEGSGRGGVPASTNGVPSPDTTVTSSGTAPTHTGGSFDFNHWDLVEARQRTDLTVNYHLIKNYILLGRIDTLILQDADFYAHYQGWYDAYPDFKERGRAEAGREWTGFSSQDKVNQFTRNELDEYYGLFNLTDALSVKVGKQQVIWTEADALSGTEITNPSDYRYGDIYDSSRVNLRMIKTDYILPDFLDTANNVFEFFVIPGDFQGGFKANIVDAQNPWIPPVPISNLTLYNQYGQPFSEQTLLGQGQTPMYKLPNVPELQLLQDFLGEKIPFYADLNVKYSSSQINNSIDNSEFGARYSTLIPIGNGLQASAIWLYEARSYKLGVCDNCTEPAPFTKFAPGVWLAVGPNNFGLKVPGLTPVYDFGPPRIKNNLGTIRLDLRFEYVRSNYLGLTGTYYDKDLTDVVFRYDTLYAPKVSSAAGGIGGVGGIASTGSAASGLFAQPKWGESTRFIIGADRPTYIPWISKQHTFLVAQYTATWNPDTPSGTRALSNFFFLAASDWLLDGRLTSLNVAAWDSDDMDGFLSTTNGYRYSSNILFDLSAIWFLGRSGLYSGSDGLGGILSRAQRTNEVQFRFTYEI